MDNKSSGRSASKSPAAQPGKPAPATNIIPKMAAKAEAAPTISQDAIAQRAYEKFCGRGYQHGFHEQDWFAAEQELKAQALGSSKVLH
jgi:hypothetical protein